MTTELRRFRVRGKQWPCPNSGAASFEGRIWRPHTSQRRVKCCPISKGPSNAAEICSLRFPDLKDASDGSFTAQHIPTFIARWMRQLQRIYFYNIFILWIYIIYYILYFFIFLLWQNGWDHFKYVTLLSKFNDINTRHNVKLINVKPTSSLPLHPPAPAVNRLPLQ